MQAGDGEAGAEQQDQRQFTELLGGLCSGMHADVVLVAVLVAAEGDAADERGQKAVGAGDLRRSVDHEHGGDREPAVELGGHQPAIAQPDRSSRKPVAERRADRHRDRDAVQHVLEQPGREPA